MTPQEAIVVLKNYNKWRLGSDDDIPMQYPKIITQAINVAISEMEKKVKNK